MKMKDEGSKRATVSDEERASRENGQADSEDTTHNMVDENSTHAAVSANGKPRSKPHRKRQSTSSPEEDIIDGFAISSFSSLESLETRGPSKPVLVNDGHHGHNKIAKRSLENGTSSKKRRAEKRRARMQDAKQKDSDTEDEIDDRAKPETSRHTVQTSNASGNHTDDNSDSGGSDKGYMCDSESEDERISEPEEHVTKSTTPHAPQLLNASERVGPSKASIDLSKDREPSVSKPSDWPSSAASAFPRASSTSTPGSSSLTLSFAATSTTTSHPLTPSFGHSHPPSLFPHFPSFHAAGGPLSYNHSPDFPYRGWRGNKDALGPPGYVMGSGQDLLRQELNSRFLQSHDRAHYLHYDNHQHQHQHQHLHQHQHQHQHQHFHSPQGVPGGPVNPLLVPSSPAVPHVIGLPPSPCAPPPGALPPPLIPRVQAELHKDPHIKPEQIPISRSGNGVTSHSRPGGAAPEVGYRSPRLHGSNQGTVSPVPVTPHQAEPTRPRGAFLGVGPLSSTSASSEVGLTQGITPYGGVLGRSNGLPGLGGVTGSSPSSFRSTSVSNSIASSLGLGSSFNSSYGGLAGIGRDWGRMSANSPSFQSWFSREMAERSRERERERDRDKSRERERIENDKFSVHALTSGNLSERERDREREKVASASHPEPETDGQKSKETSDRITEERRTEDRRSDVSRSPPPSRPVRPSSFNIASLTNDARSEMALDSRALALERERVGASLVRRDEDKVGEDRDVLMIPTDKHTAHMHGISYLDKRLYESEQFDLRLARPPLRLGPYPPHPAAMFSPGTPIASHFLPGSAMPAVSHPHPMPSFLAPSGRSMLGPVIGPPGLRSRSPLEGSAMEHIRNSELLQAAAENRP